jgi:hypothetical protein
VGRREGWGGGGRGCFGLVGVFFPWNKETRSSPDETLSSPEEDDG